MITPDIEFQTAIRAALITDPAVTGLVPTNNIRAGSMRPDKFPTLILANPQTVNLGWGSQGQKLARVYIDLHIWSVEDGAEMARQIGFAVSEALWDTPETSEIGIDEYTRPSFAFTRDPDPERAYCHGVGNVEGAIRWKI